MTVYKERLLKVIKAPHVSEKTSMNLERHNIVVLEVLKDSTKIDIKNAVYMLFSVKTNKINVLTVHGKSKRVRNKLSNRSNWKKAYVVLERGCVIDFNNKIR